MTAWRNALNITFHELHYNMNSKYGISVSQVCNNQTKHSMKLIYSSMLHDIHFAWCFFHVSVSLKIYVTIFQIILLDNSLIY